MKWGFRLAFHPAWRIGKTDQGTVFELRLRDGRPTFLNTDVEVTCSTGEEGTASWARGETSRRDSASSTASSASPSRRSARTGDGYTGTRTWTLEARFDGETASGWMAYIEELQAANGSRYDCSSGDVSFIAREPG